MLPARWLGVAGGILAADLGLRAAPVAHPGRRGARAPGDRLRRRPRRRSAGAACWRRSCRRHRGGCMAPGGDRSPRSAGPPIGRRARRRRASTRSSGRSSTIHGRARIGSSWCSATWWWRSTGGPWRSAIGCWSGCRAGIDAGSGDRLASARELELPEDFDGFAYREYLARQGVGAIGRPRSAEVVDGASGAGAPLPGRAGALLGGLNGDRARARGGARRRNPARRARVDRAGDQRRLRDRRPDPRRGDLGLEHRDRRRAGGRDGPAARAATRRPMVERDRGGGDRRGLRAAHRRQPIGRSCRAHGRLHARRRGWAGRGRMPHRRWSLRRCSCCSSRHRCCGTSGSSSRCWPRPGLIWFGAPVERRLAGLAGMDPRAGGADARRAAHDPAGHPRQLRAPVARRADRERPRRAVRAARDAVQRGRRACGPAGRGAPAARDRRRAHLVRGWLRLAGAPGDRERSAARWPRCRTPPSTRRCRRPSPSPGSRSSALASWALRVRRRSRRRRAAGSGDRRRRPPFARRAAAAADRRRARWSSSSIVTIASRPDGLLHVTVLDIGQGDAILVESADRRDDARRRRARSRS